MFKNWTNRDWFWFTGILSASIFGVVTFRLSDNLEVINLFSFISSSISIALAIIAIYIALKQDRDSRSISKETSILLNAITGKIEGMDSKIDKLDPRTVTEPVEDQLKDEIEKIINSVDTQVNPKIIDEINSMINEKFNSINQNLDSYYDKKPSNRVKKYYIKIHVPSNYQNEIPKFIKDFDNEFKVISISHSLEENLLTVNFYHIKAIDVKEIKDFVIKNGFGIIRYGRDSSF
ncbi:hypothetical protein [Lysinibacillus capsici]|uniref:hypothetical protein n=1 Tax=Lysinibacillus capsici TaxID=2115968 RepID=UPI00247FB9AC|nr:hypothetical protein [Lysinibacillus capsici]